MFSFSKFTALPLLAATLFGTGAANAGVVYDALGGTGNGGDPIAAAGPILRIAWSPRARTAFPR